MAAPVSRLMKMPLQSNTAPSASSAQNAIAPSAASRRDGRAKRGPSGRGSASAGGNPLEARVAATTPSPTTMAMWGSGSSPAAAARPPITAPPSAPNENHACSELKMRLPERRSTASPSTFMDTSSTPLAAPAVNVPSASVGASTARAGATAAASSSGDAATRRRAPTVAARAPVSGCAASSPTGAPISARPSVPGPRSSFSWMLGRREYQDAKTIPLRKKTVVTATLARLACATRLCTTCHGAGAWHERPRCRRCGRCRS